LRRHDRRQRGLAQSRLVVWRNVAAEPARQAAGIGRADALPLSRSSTACTPTAPSAWSTSHRPSAPADASSRRWKQDRRRCQLRMMTRLDKPTRWASSDRQRGGGQLLDPVRHRRIASRTGTPRRRTTRGRADRPGLDHLGVFRALLPHVRLLVGVRHGEHDQRTVPHHLLHIGTTPTPRCGFDERAPFDRIGNHACGHRDVR